MRLRGLKQNLADNLVLRCALKSDIKAILDHVVIVHGKEIVPMTRRMLKAHPDFPIEDNFIVEDTSTGKVVAYVCLMRSTCVLEGVSFPVGHMEIVGTLPEYRNQGLIRKLNDVFNQRVEEYKLPLVVIIGIAYYYRKYGYEYAIPNGGVLTVAKDLVPSLDSGEKELVIIKKVRSSTISDYLKCRKKENSYLNFYRDLNVEEMKYFGKGKLGEELARIFYLVKQGNNYVGCFSLTVAWKSLEIQGLWVEDLSVIPSILRYAKKVAIDKELPLRINKPSNPAITSYLERNLRSKFRRPYAWYVKIPSIPQFLMTIKPVLNKRLAKSDFHKFNETLRLSCYNEGYELSFNKGKLIKVKRINQQGIKNMHVALPPMVVYQLLMGYRSFEELERIYPDVNGRPFHIPLVNVLFPKIRAMISPEL
jgi:N-acetylglutamate synthase-like GNAT family acetyltransferase